MSDVAVAVVSWNTRELLARCLESLRDSAERGVAEVWVVDNGSDDGSPELVSQRFGWARMIANRDNLGFGAAVNQVAACSSSPWIAASNADVELAPDALARLLAAGREHSDAGALAPQLVMPDGEVQHSVHAFPSLGLALAFNLGLARVVPGLGDRLCLEGRWDPARERDVDWAHGAFLLLGREAFDSAGGFDPEQWMYAEDLDLCWRLAAAGRRTRYVPTATVRHEAGAAARQAFADESTARQLAAGYSWMKRRRGAAATRAYAGLNAVGCAVRLAVIAPASRIWPRRYGARRELETRYLRLHREALRALGSGEGLGGAEGGR